VVKNKIAILGSGISGISLAKCLSEKNYNVNLFEKNKKIGGLIKCDFVNGVLFHRVGGHVFNSKNKDVLEWFWKHFDVNEEFIPAKRNAKILLENKLIGYPIENNLHELQEYQLLKITNELLCIYKSNFSQIDNFENFLVNSFGKTLYNLYFKPYNTKIWNTNLSEIPLDWLEGKLPMPNIVEIFKNNILKKEENQMVHSTFWYPKNNGSQFIIDRLAENLDITCNYEIRSIKYADKKLLLNEEFNYDSLVYTGDIRKLRQILKLNNSQLDLLLKEAEDLKSNGTSNVLCYTDRSDLSWLYIPEEKFECHRIIYTGNFSPHNNNDNHRKTCVVEFSGKHEIKKMIESIKLLPGNLDAIEFNYEPNSYVIQSKKTRKLIYDIKNILQKYNIFLHGRFAEWEYYNMDICIEKSMKLSNIL